MTMTNISALQQRINTILTDYANGRMTAPMRDAMLMDLQVHYTDVSFPTFNALVIQSKQKAAKV